jgi:hypothetical protein
MGANEEDKTIGLPSAGTKRDYPGVSELKQKPAKK